MVAVLGGGGATKREHDLGLPGARWARIWFVPLLVGLGVYAVAVGAAVNLLNDGDTLSHIAIGRWIIGHLALPFHDPFSDTFKGGIWVPHEWLAEVVFAEVYDRLGWGGIVAATGLAIAAAFALLTRALQTSLGPRRAAIGAALAFLLTEAHLLARPHVLALPLLVIWMSAVIKARDQRHIPSLGLLPVITVWCNLHGGFVVGLAFAGLLAVEAALDASAADRVKVLRGWGVFLTLSALAALISPNGIDLFTLPLHMLQMSFATSSISEWRSADFSHFDALELWIGLAILGGVSLGLRLPLSRSLMVLLLLYLALTHVRNKELLGIIAPLLLAAPLAKQLGSTSPPPNGALASGARSSLAARLAAASGLAAVVALGFVATALALDRRGIAPPGHITPTAALEAARKAGLRDHVFNSVRFGGYLISAGVPTFVDGRADLFGDAFLQRYVAAWSGVGQTLPELLDHYRVGWTLLEPQSPAAGLLDHDPGWERVYADPYAVIHRRRSPPP